MLKQVQHDDFCGSVNPLYIGHWMLKLHFLIYHSLFDITYELWSATIFHSPLILRSIKV
jgi:hypothetical protein